MHAARPTIHRSRYVIVLQLLPPFLQRIAVVAVAELIVSVCKLQLRIFVPSTAPISLTLRITLLVDRAAVHRSTLILSTTAIIDAASMSQRSTIHSAIAPPFRKGTQIRAVPISVLRPAASSANWIALHVAVGWIRLIAILICVATPGIYSFIIWRPIWLACVRVSRPSTIQRIVMARAKRVRCTIPPSFYRKVAPCMMVATSP